MCLNPRPFFLRPIHGPDVKRDILIEFLYPLTRETNPGFCRDGWLQEELHCRVIDARAWSSRSGVTPSNARAPSNTIEQSQAAWVRGPMIGTLPSCQSPSKNVQVLDQPFPIDNGLLPR